MRKKIAALLAASIVLGALAGCSGSQGGAQATTAAETTAASTTSAGESKSAENSDSKEKVVLNWLHRYPEERYVNYFQSLADGYMAEHPNVQINVEVVGDVAMKDKLKVMVGGGEIPDIFYSWPGEFAGQFARNGKVLDLTPYIEADTEWKDSISSVFWDYVDMYDMHVGVPFRFSLSVMEYNKAIFEECGIEVPETFSELKEVCQVLKDHGYIPIAFGDNPNWPTAHYLTQMFPQYVGSEVYANDCNPATGEWTDPGYVEAIQALQELVQSGCFNDNINSLSYDQATLLFYEKKAAMLYGGSMAMEKAAVELGDDNLGWMKFPVADNGKGTLNTVCGGCDLFLVSAETKHPDEAVDFLKYIPNKQNQMELAKQTGLQPVAKDTITNETAHKTIVEFNDYTFEESDGITTWLDTAPESRVKEKFLENLQLIIDGKDASEIMKEIQDVAAQVRGEYAN